MSSPLRSSTVIFALLSITLGGCAVQQHPSQAQQLQSAPSFAVKILHINDHHSHLDAEDWVFPADVGDGPEKISVSRGGFARVATFMKQSTDQQLNVLKMHAGDATTGDLYYSLSDGRADAIAMNQVCFDSMTLGNHEFDGKETGLARFLNFLDDGTCRQPTAILSANVQFGASSPLFHTPRVTASTIVQRQGEKLAIIGISPAKKIKNASQPNADTIISDEIEAAQAEIDRLKQQGINKIILQSHVGFEADQILAAALPDVDVIIGGDSHTLLGPAVLKQYGMSPAAAYPLQLRNKQGNLVCIAQAWQYSAVVGELNVQFDPNGRVTQCSGTSHVLVGQDFKHPNGQLLNPTEQQVLLTQFRQQQVPMTVLQEDVATLAALRAYREQKIKFSQTVLAHSPQALCARRVPGRHNDISRSALGDDCNQNAHVLAHGGDAQQLVAAAFLQQGKLYFAADFSLLNAGSVRVDIPAGDVNTAQVFALLPFKNTLLQLNMTAGEIKTTLEDAIEQALQGNSGSYPYAAGLRWHVDLNQPKGQRIHQLQIKTAQGTYVTLEPNRLYKMITTDFLANGGDGYHPLIGIQGERRVNVGLDATQSFIQYLFQLPGEGAQKNLQRVATADYSTQQMLEQ